MNISSKTIEIASVVAGVLALLLAPFVTYASLIAGIGVIVLGGVAAAMGKDDYGNDGERPTAAIVAIGLGVVIVLVGVVTLVTGRPLYLMLVGG